ncbi:nucleoside deaminase [Vagococcus vulneris]|uniref:tRNA-specific adenosine deaminase n=1 Tax=Vagococcus vulneris TaxID=1977869 RepID=A0A429ZVP0_9ENTE|nr:nucleoside deaminase [Vagococcus vulneris]RST97693.1 tRNA-specific adenosine deaminase [Vagococcus vulneris]
MESKDYIELACDAAILGMMNYGGGPFGATIVKEGRVIASVANTMVRDTDPSAHAEIMAIRKASKILGTMDLTGCEIYATCEPCPMCVGAMMLANIDKVYYVSTHEDAAMHGFPDNHLRNYLNGTDQSCFQMEKITARQDCDELWNIYNVLNNID